MEPDANDDDDPSRAGEAPAAAEPPTFAESFIAAEQAAFDFLVDEHGFHRDERRVGRDDAERGVFGRVVYRSPASPEGVSREVTLTIAPLRLQLELALSRTSSPPCLIEELHALEGRGAFPRREYSLYDAMHEPEQLQAEFARLARVLRAIGARFFEDDPYLWEDLEARRARQADDDAIRRQLALSRERFRARAWQDVIDILAPLEYRLGRTASARLDYAKRKLREGA